MQETGYVLLKMVMCSKGSSQKKPTLFLNISECVWGISNSLRKLQNLKYFCRNSPKFQYRNCGNPCLTLNFNIESVINPDPS